jgi:hypothetical protein
MGIDFQNSLLLTLYSLLFTQASWGQTAISAPENELKYSVLTIGEGEWQPAFAGEWQIEQSFRAAYVSWNLVETFEGNWQPKPHRSTRNFDDDYSLDRFYHLGAEFTTNFKTGSLEHETSLSLEIDRNLFSLSRPIPVNEFNSTSIPSRFSPSDWIRRHNSLDISLEHGIALGSGFSLYINGEIDLEIPEVTATPELPTFVRVEGEPFAPEISIYYEPNQSLSFYAS